VKIRVIRGYFCILNFGFELSALNFKFLSPPTKQSQAAMLFVLDF